MKQVLTIAGSDGSGGAGIQGDLKTISAHGFHGLTAITAITAQNTSVVEAIFPVPNLAQQLHCLASDITIHGVKIGMIGSLSQVSDITNWLLLWIIPHGIPIVYDPVMCASTGKAFMAPDLLTAVISTLMPLCTLITPNHDEAQLMAHELGIDSDNSHVLVHQLSQSLGTAVLLKGGHITTDTEHSNDYLVHKGRLKMFTQPRLPLKNTHGTGCCLSSAIACQLAQGAGLEKAVALGKSFVTLAIKKSYALGKGEGPVNPLIHFITNNVTSNDVANCCLAVGGRPIMAEAAEEMVDIVPGEDGLVINIGTLTLQKYHAMLTALEHIDCKRQKVLLDPVGCGASNFRLEKAKTLLETGKIHVLKVNPQEGLALCGNRVSGAYGVDSDRLNVHSKEQLAKNLLKLYGPMNEHLVVVVTGSADVIANKESLQVIRGGTKMQQRITGTGCMLNAVIMTAITQCEDLMKGVVLAIKSMNQASERATKRLRNKQHLMTYKQLLINELTAMNKDIYLITDESLDFDTALLPLTEQALACGVSTLQYRVKSKDPQQKFHEAMTLRDLTHQYGVTFIINDDLILAKSVGADGVHLGIEDSSVQSARELLGDKCLIGATAKTVAQAIKAEAMGADYLGVGALYPSPTKENARQITVIDLEKIRDAVNIPVYGIGGLRHHNLTEAIINAVDGVAVISAVYEGGMDELSKIQQRISLY